MGLSHKKECSWINRPRVVLADDIPASVRAWEKILGSSCDVIAIARDGRSALAAIRGLKPEIAILDLNMPGLNGIQVTQCALKEQPSLGVVICSVTRHPDIVEAAAQAGARAYVCKADLYRHLLRAVITVADGDVYFPSAEETVVSALGRVPTHFAA